MFVITNPTSSAGSANDSVAHTFYLDSKAKVGQYLKSVEDNYSNINPLVIDRNGSISAIVISNRLGELDQFSFALHVNGVQVYSNSKPAGVTRFEYTGLNLSISIGDEISVRIFNLLDDIDHPKCTVFFRNS